MLLSRKGSSTHDPLNYTLGKPRGDSHSALYTPGADMLGTGCLLCVANEAGGEEDDQPEIVPILIPIEKLGSVPTWPGATKESSG